MRNVGIIYLYRHAEGEAPVLRFLQSYRARRAGIEHDLNVVFKGFPDADSVARGRSLFSDHAINPIEVDDSGYDLGAYFKGAAAVGNQRLIFLNTFSELLADDWLAHFSRALDSDRVGLVGATGSWAANTAGYEATLRFVIRKLLRRPARYFQAFDSDPSTAAAPHAGQRATRLLKLVAFAPFDYIQRLKRFGRYPNPHIRTNAFMIDRKRFLSLDVPPFMSKIGAYKFESGRRSMTKQILKQNMRAVIVGRNGDTYDVPNWKAASTFRINEQANLIVADNRTSDYAEADANRRDYLEKLTWVHPSKWDDSPLGHTISPDRV